VMEELQYHPIAELLPALQGTELRKLASDIKANGLLEPIVLYEGMILDGRNRYQCCLTESVEPRFVLYEGQDPGGFVISMNILRRHLTTQEQTKLTKDLIKLAPLKSDRAIAKPASSA